MSLSSVQKLEPEARAGFLSQAGWDRAQAEPLAGDMAARRYTRLREGGVRTAILLEAVPDNHPEATPGHKLSDWLRFQTLYKRAGLSVPDVYAADVSSGFLLVEDFGDVSYTQALEAGEDAVLLYQDAVEAAKKINAIPASSDIVNFEDSFLVLWARRVVDWYAPLVRGRANESGLVDEFQALLSNLRKDVVARHGLPQLVFSHMDFHAGNLFVLPHRFGAQRCGILDFQTAMKAPGPYDLLNVLQDARRSMPPALQNQLVDMYLGPHRSKEERDSFKAWMMYCGVLFHARVAGQFVRAALYGMDRYLAFLPVVTEHLRADLNHDLAAPLQRFFERHHIGLIPPTRLKKQALKPLIAPDAV